MDHRNEIVQIGLISDYFHVDMNHVCDRQLFHAQIHNVVHLGFNSVC